MTSIRFTRRTVSLTGIKLDLLDVAKIFARLLAQVHEQREREITQLTKPSEQSAEDFEKFRESAKQDAFRATVTIRGDDGNELYGDSEQLFTSNLLPDRIQAIYITNVTAYQSFSSRRPSNLFELNLDFSRPPLLDDSNISSSPTPNASHLTIEGERDGWIAGIIEAVEGITRNRRTKRSIIHKSAAFDFMTIFISLPAGLYACWRLSPLVEKIISPYSTFLSAAIYVYVAILVIQIFRMLFGYSRWAFPTVELASNRDSAISHRAAWGAIVLSLVATAVWELLALAGS